MILLIILFTPLLSSSNTWLQKQCIREGANKSLI